MKSTTSTWKSLETFLVCLYLVAIVASNLTISILGPEWSIVTAFVFIGLDLTSRDALHEVWKRFRILKMVVLIFSGSAISYALNKDAGSIALASMVAFGVSSILDFAVYSMFCKLNWFVKVNGSNVAGAAADSLIFPTLAFGGFMPMVTAGQFVAKVGGGLIWGLILSRTAKSGKRE